MEKLFNAILLDGLGCCRGCCCCCCWKMCCWCCCHTQRSTCCLGEINRCVACDDDLDLCWNACLLCVWCSHRTKQLLCLLIFANRSDDYTPSMLMLLLIPACDGYLLLMLLILLCGHLLLLLLLIPLCGCSLLLLAIVSLIWRRHFLRTVTAGWMTTFEAAVKRFTHETS